jgi:phage shock protein PspC (stress-responsive transcriptional regulator)
MSEILRKLTSRKLWLAIAGVATGVAMVLGVEGSEITTVAGAVTALASVITYIITEGKIDAESVKNLVGEIMVEDGFEIVKSDKEV